MTPTTISKIIQDLQFRPAGKIESQTLEFKSWCRDEKDLSSEICDAAVCLANADGGMVVIGVDDKKVGGAAITRCPHLNVSVDWIKSRIREFTRPPVQCQVHQVRDIVPDLDSTPFGDLYVVDVSQTTHPSGHRTHRGISLVRANNECRTNYQVENDDYTDVWMDNLSFSSLDEKSLNDGLEKRLSVYNQFKILGPRPIDHLTSSGLVQLEESPNFPRKGYLAPSMAALLMFGREDIIKQTIQSAGTVITIESSITAPFTSSNWYNLLESLERYVKTVAQYLDSKEVEFPKDIINELLLNAYLHRCYRTPGPVQIRIRRNEIEIQNPGGLMGGLTTETLIYSPPIYRNFKLADAARQFGYCEKAGAGIDKIYHLALLTGLDFPVFQSEGNSFTAIVRTTRDEPFVKFIKDYSGNLELSLPDLMVIRVLRSRGETTMPYLVKMAQRPLRYMEDALQSLQKRNIVQESSGNKYRLTESVLNHIARYDDRGQLRLF